LSSTSTPIKNLITKTKLKSKTWLEKIKLWSNEIMDEVQKVDDAEFSKIVPALLKKGIDNIDLSMFGDEAKIDLLNRAGDELYKRGNYAEAIKALFQ